MSNKILLGLFAAIALNALTGMIMLRSSLGPGGIGNGATYIEGIGGDKKIRLTATDFSHLEIEGNYQINLIQGEEEYVEIEAQENIVNLFRVVKTKENTLSIDAKEGYTISPTAGIVITIGFKDLNVINSYGVSKFYSQQTLDFEELFIGLHGASYIETPITAKKLKLQFNGACNGNLTGTVADLDVTMSGGSSLHAQGLVVQKAHAVVNGGGFADLAITEYLNARTAGGGSIQYSGDPKVDQHSAGAGRVYKK